MSEYYDSVDDRTAEEKHSGHCRHKCNESKNKLCLWGLCPLPYENNDLSRVWNYQKWLELYKDCKHREKEYIGTEDFSDWR